MSINFSLCWKIFLNKGGNMLLFLSYSKRARGFLDPVLLNALPLQQHLTKDLFILCVCSSSLPILQTGLHPRPAPALTVPSPCGPHDLEAATSGSLHAA